MHPMQTCYRTSDASLLEGVGLTYRLVNGRCVRDAAEQFEEAEDYTHARSAVRLDIECSKIICKRNALCSLMCEL